MIEKLEEVLKSHVLCNFCLGRLFSQLLTGLSNYERGRTIRLFLAMLYENYKKMNIDVKNFYGIKFRSFDLKIGKESCYICNDFFEEKINLLVKKNLEKIKKIEFETFLVGTEVPKEIREKEEKIWEIVGIENVESIKSDVNREVGKILEKLTGKKFNRENPDILIKVDLKKIDVSIKISSIFIYGKYKKLVRGIPQAKWLCLKCKGKGCSNCNYKGKLYRTSVQEIIEKPLIKVSKCVKTRFSGMGREDIDVRCLDYRPFVIELVEPKIRKIDIKSIESTINKSKYVKVKLLKFVDKNFVRKLKSEKVDKKYLAIVEFEDKINKSLLKDLKVLEKITINQITPLRVVHRRSNILRKRRVRKIYYKLISEKKLKLTIVAESGLYVKELIHGDYGRTKPSVAEILNNKVKSIVLDVVKIYA